MIHNKRRKAGISDVLATVIIVAATVAIALVAIAYFTGLVGGATHTQQVEVVGSPQLINESDNKWHFIIHLHNIGDKDAVLSYVQIGNEYIELSHPAAGYTVTIKGNSTTPEGYPTIPAGKIVSIDITLTGSYDIGRPYHFAVGVSGGSTVTGDVTASG